MARDIRGIQNIEVFSPSVQVRFHTDHGQYEVESKRRGIGGAEDALVSCQTYKDISQSTGTFIVHLADYARFDRMLKPMDLCSIKMSNHTPVDSRNGLVPDRDRITHATMIGLIDSVRRKRLIDPQTGKPNIFCEIRGRDFGKLFVKHQVRYIPFLQDGTDLNLNFNPVAALFKQFLSGFATGGPIDFLVANNMRRFFTESVNLSLPFNGRSLNLKNAISYRAMADMGIIPYNLPLQAQEGSLWTILQNYANLPFNELWIDTINNPERVISAKEASPLSSPLTTADLTAAQQRAAQYIKLQTGADQKQSIDLFGANGEKISMGEKYVGSPDNCNAYTMVFFRRTPFDRDDWRALPTITIHNSDIIEQDLGTSDNETYNMFWVYPLLAVPGELPLKGLGIRPIMFTNETQYATAPQNASGAPRAIIIQGNGQEANQARAIARRNAVEKFGFQPLEIKTRVWRWANGKALKNAVQTAEMLTLAIANWNKHNSYLKSGSLTVKGLPDLHVGNKIYNEDENEEYYVEGIANNYVQYQPITSTLMVTRGQRPGEIDWGTVYTDYCKNKPLKVGDQEEITQR